MRNSIVIHRDENNFATLTYSSTNRKTGPGLAQVHILHRHESPIDAVQSGADVSICGECKYRRLWDELREKFTRKCYVNLGHAPQKIWKTVRRHPVTGIQKAISRLGTKGIRLGAYGDPGFLPLNLVRTLCAGKRRRTAYTHQWRKISKQFSRYMMASVDTAQERLAAKKLGYRTFRAVASLDEIQPGELVCPNTTHGVQCDSCGLCYGAGPEKDIIVQAHGSGAVYMQIEAA